MIPLSELGVTFSKIILEVTVKLFTVLLNRNCTLYILTLKYKEKDLFWEWSLCLQYSRGYNQLFCSVRKVKEDGVLT